MNDDAKIIVVGDLNPDNKWGGVVTRQNNIVISTEGISMCIPATHSRHEFKIMETTDKAILTPIRSEEQKAARRAGQDCKFGERPLQPREDGVSNTLTSVAKDNLVVEREVLEWKQTICKHTRIRRLTERELFRLMDVEEPDIDTLLSAGIAKTQLAKMAGNSIVVACLYHIFDRLFVHTEAAEGMQTKLF